MQIGVITNPNSRKNKGRPNRAADLQEIVGHHGEVHATDSVDSIKPILRDFLRRRARFWVADGGDGALHWMLRTGLELLEEDEFNGGDYELPITVPTNGGTIDFVANNVGIEGQAEDILDALCEQIESGKVIEEVEVDSMLIEGIKIVNGVEEPFRTYGFASAVGGVAQRFYSKYYESSDPNPRTIVRILGQAFASMPVSMSPLRSLPGMPSHLKDYARDLFTPIEAKVTLDGTLLPNTRFSGVNIGSMSINIGGIFRIFSKADTQNQMHAILGSSSPLTIVANLPALCLGRNMKGRGFVDRPCMELKVEAIQDELLAPVIDGEYYPDVKSITFKVGPRLRIPKIVSKQNQT